MYGQKRAVTSERATTFVESEAIQKSLVQVLRKEAEAIFSAIDQFPSNAWKLVDSILSIKGKVIFLGIGKSGLVAKKLAATWSSLGIPAMFLHPTDALHGDLGVIQKKDFCIVLSKSGTGNEFEQILPLLKSDGILTTLICCSNKALLSGFVDLTIVLSLEKEACFLNLAPTSSSTVMVAFGDAVAVVASDMKNFTKHKFARYHPAGALGRKLFLTVRSFMYSGEDLPFVVPTASFKDLLITITTKKLGLGIVIDEKHHLKGIITDGDLRRACELGAEIFSKNAIDIATNNPKFISPETLAFAALEIIENFNITSLLVIEKDVVVGLIHIHDLIKAGIRG